MNNSTFSRKTFILFFSIIFMTFCLLGYSYWSLKKVNENIEINKEELIKIQKEHFIQKSSIDEKNSEFNKKIEILVESNSLKIIEGINSIQSLIIWGFCAFVTILGITFYVFTSSVRESFDILFSQINVFLKRESKNTVKKNVKTIDKELDDLTNVNTLLNNRLNLYEKNFKEISSFVGSVEIYVDSNSKPNDVKKEVKVAQKIVPKKELIKPPTIVIKDTAKNVLNKIPSYDHAGFEDV